MKIRVDTGEPNSHLTVVRSKEPHGLPWNWEFIQYGCWEQMSSLRLRIVTGDLRTDSRWAAQGAAPFRPFFVSAELKQPRHQTGM